MDQKCYVYLFIFLISKSAMFIKLTKYYFLTKENNVHKHYIILLMEWDVHESAIPKLPVHQQHSKQA